MCYSAIVENNLEEIAGSLGAELDDEAFDVFRVLSRKDPTKYKTINENSRIYPNYYAPVIVLRDETRLIEPMRYSIFSPSFIDEEKKFTPFNARRDHLNSKFWSESFMIRHGIIIIKGFYEWVPVKQAVKAGITTLDEVKEEFKKAAEERKRRFLTTGREYKPTKTELKDPEVRDLVLYFSPSKNKIMLVPVVYTEMKEKDGIWHKGFAIVTDSPPPEIRATGHDRAPVNIADGVVDDWLSPRDKSNKDIEMLLDQKRDEEYQCTLAKGEI